LSNNVTALLHGHRVKRLLGRMLDETEFLSDYGIRAISKYHEQHPYVFNVGGMELSVNYLPSESNSSLSDYADYVHGISLFVGGMTLYPGFETGG
jgi:hypothetical protein